MTANAYGDDRDMADTHSPLIKTPQQLIVVVAAAFVVPIVVIMLVAALVTSGRHDTGEGAEKAIATRIAPVGTVVIAPGPSTLTATAAAAPAATAAAPQAPVVAASIPPPAAPAAAGKADGKKVYDTACVACHTPGVAGAPKLGDKANWAPRLAQGANVLYDHAIKGYQGKAGVMPAKGGNPALSDAEVQAAVDYMTASVK